MATCEKLNQPVYHLTLTEAEAEVVRALCGRILMGSLGETLASNVWSSLKGAGVESRYTLDRDYMPDGNIVLKSVQ